MKTFKGNGTKFFIGMPILQRLTMRIEDTDDFVTVSISDEKGTMLQIALTDEMKAGIDTRKWICVEADDVKTAVYGDLVCFCMIDSEYADALTADDVTGAFTKIMNGEATYEEGAAPNIPEIEG